MTHSEDSYTPTHPNLEDNVYWQSRQALCYFANLDGRSEEDESIKWLSHWKWCADVEHALTGSNATDLIKTVAMLHQWLVVLSTTSQDVRDSWANEYAATRKRRGAQ